MNRLKEKYTKEVVPSLTKVVRLQERGWRAQDLEDRGQTWASARRTAKPPRKIIETGARRARPGFTVQKPVTAPGFGRKS